MDPRTKELFERFLDQYKQAYTPKIDLAALCFPPQFAFITDESLFVTGMTSRRAGKTTACALDLLATALKAPRSVCLYITLARTNAKRIIWPELKRLNQEMTLRAEINESDLSIKFANGSVIYCSGAATSGEIDRFRGLAIKVVYVDEAQSFGLYLRQLIDDVLVPACFDNRGKIRLIGTPPPVPVGYFIDAHRSSEWSHHHWTMFENPWIEKKRGESPQAILDQELKRRGVTIDDPTIQREMLGRVSIDTKRLVLEYNPDRNDYIELPKGKYTHIFGIDLGYEDADAIAVLGYRDDSSNTYLIDELVTEKQGLTPLIAQIEALRAKYQPIKLMIDTGGLGLKLADEMRRQYRIPVQAADKARKFETYEILNDSLRTGRFCARRSSRFASDSNLLEWDADKSKPDRRVVSDRFHSDIIDAVLYAFKESPAFSYQEPKPLPEWGSADWAKAEERRMEEEAEEFFKKQETQDELEWL